ncbi:MAG: hypothetical protein QF915_02895 [Candidatus Woesearchaeota archaeon]|jgi:hypothetical protein|nr:hypothetical protein [Candidatus Woesearchaeota archaeon]
MIVPRYEHAVEAVISPILGCIERAPQEAMELYRRTGEVLHDHPVLGFSLVVGGTALYCVLAGYNVRRRLGDDSSIDNAVTD